MVRRFLVPTLLAAVAAFACFGLYEAVQLGELISADALFSPAGGHHGMLFVLCVLGVCYSLLTIWLVANYRTAYERERHAIDEREQLRRRGAPVHE